MAIQKVVAVFDRGISSYGRPFAVPHVGQAVREFTDLCQDRENPIGKHPQDYQLYELGIYDDSSGRFDNLNEPRLLISGSDIKGG